MGKHPAAYRIFEREYSVFEYNVYIIGEIQEPDMYYDLISLFRSAPENAIINVFINSIGGIFPTAIQLINAIRDCRATVSMIADGECHSAASFIMLSGDKFKVNPNASMLCHTYSGSRSGKSNEIRTSVEFDLRFNTTFIKNIYAGFMDDDEIQRMINGEDFWFDAVAIDERLRRMVQLRGRNDTCSDDMEVISYDEEK